MKKHVVIAGNGPSLANINYHRLPKEYDVYRVNNFYFEEKYFLGKRVTKYIVAYYFLNFQFNTLYHLQEREEYTIDNITCFHFEDIVGEIPKKALDTFPHIDWILSRYTSHKSIDDYLSLQSYYYHKHPQTGTIALLHAIQEGYTEIYITGIDFYQTAPYTFNTHKPNYYQMYEKQAKESDRIDGAFDIVAHSKEMEMNIIKLCSKLENIRIYSICDHSPINELLPLAPIQNDNNFIVEEKSPDHIMDWIPVVKYDNKPSEIQRPAGKLQILKKMFENKEMHTEWEQIRSNIFLRILKDILQPVYILFKFIFKK